MFMDRALNGYISRDNSGSAVSVQLQEMDYISDVIRNYQSNEDIFKIRFFLKADKLYLHENVNFFSYQALDTIAWYPKAAELNGSVYWKGTYLQPYIDVPEEYIVTCARELNDLNELGKSIGALMIDVRESTLYQLIGESQVSNKENIFIVDEENSIISHADKSRLGASFSYPEPLKEGINKHGRQYVLCHTIPMTGWKIVSVMSANDVFADARGTSGFINVMIIVAIFVIFMAAFFIMLGYLVLSVNRRINNVVVKIENEGIGAIDDPPSANKESVYNLEHAIDAVIRNLKELTERTYRAETEKKASELRILQAQINPHFLYNTLDNISWMAIKSGARDVSKMIQLLSKYFRLSLNQGRDIVRIEDEITLAKVYMDMINSRFEGTIAFHMEVDWEARQYSIPKLTLQPILENAVMHGLQRKEDKNWQVWLEVRMEGGDVLLIVTDNGAGMTREVLDNLLNEPQKKEKFSYGLYNVNQRIRLLFGEGYGVSVTSEIGRGTVVKVRIKAIEAEA